MDLVEHLRLLHFGWRDAVEIAVVAFVLYRLLLLLHGTRAVQMLLGIVVLALLAVVLALCSEADAFVAASLSMLPLLPRLVFLVVGPAIDVKLFSLQAGTFGRAFAIRFAPLSFVVAIGCAVVSGLIILGGAR